MAPVKWALIAAAVTGSALWAAEPGTGPTAGTGPQPTSRADGSASLLEEYLGCLDANSRSIHYSDPRALRAQLGPRGMLKMGWLSKQSFTDFPDLPDDQIAEVLLAWSEEGGVTIMRATKDAPLAAIASGGPPPDPPVKVSSPIIEFQGFPYARRLAPPGGFIARIGPATYCHCQSEDLLKAVLARLARREPPALAEPLREVLDHVRDCQHLLAIWHRPERPEPMEPHALSFGLAARPDLRAKGGAVYHDEDHARDAVATLAQTKADLGSGPPASAPKPGTVLLPARAVVRGIELARRGRGVQLTGNWKLADLPREACSDTFLDVAHDALSGSRIRTEIRLTDSAGQPLKPVTIQDVLEANIPTPTRSLVSFPAFSCKQAFPEANAEPELVIARFGESPWFKPGGRQAIPEDWRGHYPQRLPPVADRLPRNPAVVVGPDGLGRYGGVWRRCTREIGDFTRKLCHESLTRHDPSGRLQPCLAYKWEVSPDQRVFTFHLRKGHKWSDGHPFTTEDILWVCNSVIGSAAWPTPPDWMRATDGFTRLYEDDVADWAKLCRAIVEQARQAGPSVGGRIKALGDAELWKDIVAAASAGGADADAAGRITDGLNILLARGDFHSPAAFAGVDLAAEQRELQKLGASRLAPGQMDQLLALTEREELLRTLAADPNALAGDQVLRLNVSLFRSAYRGLVGPARRARVEVQAVPDEAGDASHIVRFTFAQPNSIFLEQTPVFMFYRGLFDMPRHVTAPIHPAGQKDLAASDVLDWKGLFETIRRQAAASGPSPGKSLWGLLPEPLRRRIESETPTNESSEAYKGELLAAINQALSQPGYFQPGAWRPPDLEPWKRNIHDGNGLASLGQGADGRQEFRDILVLEDLLRRLAADGPQALDRAEHLRLNVLLFRGAYSELSGRALVARSRAEGLDRAAREDPAKYPGWIARFYDRMTHHPARNPHYPVLGAWRIVSPKDAPEILAVRNPFYYRVDAAGNQLPYIDAVRTTIAPEKWTRLIKMGSGAVDFQARDVTFDEYPMLHEAEREGQYELRLWAGDYCGELTACPIQTPADPARARLNEDPNFRHALSLAINRRRIIDGVFMGMGSPAQFCVPEGSPYYSAAMARQSVEHDPARANRLLDAMGLDRRGADGFRLLPDGRPLELRLATAQEGMSYTAARMAALDWQDVGINVTLDLLDRRALYEATDSGAVDVRFGDDGATFFGPLYPGNYHASHPAESPQWSRWAEFLNSRGARGWPPPRRIWQIERLWETFLSAPSPQAKMAAWQAVTDRFAADLPVIGVMTALPKVVYVRKGFKNVPRVALAGWIAHEPGNCCPECFYFEQPAQPEPW